MEQVPGVRPEELEVDGRGSALTLTGMHAPGEPAASRAESGSGSSGAAATAARLEQRVWVAERLLGVEIPKPPANIEPISPDTRGATTLREQLALHSQQASCAACHARFDGYGFALESFDVTGRHRKKYRVLDHDVATLPPKERRGRQLWKDGLPVDAAGVDAEELRGLAGQPSHDGAHIHAPGRPGMP